jgi:hypothetical protein
MATDFDIEFSLFLLDVAQSWTTTILQGNVREREPWRTKHEAPKEGQVDAAGHLQEWIEVRNGIETAEPARQTGTSATAKHSERIE